MATPPRQNLLVIGAFTEIGLASIHALQALAPERFTIIAVLKPSQSLDALDDKPNIVVHHSENEGNPDQLFAELQQQSLLPWGILDLPTTDDAVVDEEQSKALVRTATANNVRHFVYVSAEKGHSRSSGSTDGRMTLSEGPARVEESLATASKGSAVSHASRSMTYAVLRPTVLMERLLSAREGPALARLWQLSGPNRPLQLVDAADVGRFAAMAMILDDDKLFCNHALTLAGERLTFDEANAQFAKIVGREMPLGTTADTVQALFAGDPFAMVRWVHHNGDAICYVNLCRQTCDVHDFSTWLGEHKQMWP